MKNIFRITFKQQLRDLFDALNIYAYLALFILVFNIQIGMSALIITGGIIFLIDIFPALLLHISYLAKNRKAVLIIDTDSRTISYNNAKTNVTFSFDDIVLFKYVASYGVKAAAGWYAFGDYRYCQIICKNNNEIIVTSLMVHDVKNTLEMLLRQKAVEKYQVIAFLPRKSSVDPYVPSHWIEQP